VRTIVTDLCVFERFDGQSLFVLTALLPAAGHNVEEALDEVRRRTGFGYTVAQPVTPGASPHTRGARCATGNSPRTGVPAAIGALGPRRTPRPPETVLPLRYSSSAAMCPTSNRHVSRKCSPKKVNTGPP